MKGKIDNPIVYKPLWLVSILMVVALAACQSATTPPPASAVPPTTAPATAAPTQAAAAMEANISVVNDPKLGNILVGNNGMTLYIFTKDGPDQSNCTGGCLKQWPPLLTEGHPVLGAGIDPALVGTAKLPDGSLIVTYNKMPLYYWANDKKAGDTTGEGVGSVWFVVSPDGKPVTAAISSGSGPNGYN